MGEAALKLEKVLEEKQKDFPLYHLFTKALIESLSPILKSDLFLGNLENHFTQQTFDYWIEARVKGDLEGVIGLGADESTLNRFKEASEASQTLVYLHETIVEGFENQFLEEDFQCQTEKGSGLLKNYALKNQNQECLFLCPVETQYGILKIFFCLKPTNQTLQEEFRKKNHYEPRKIRVYASELDELFANIKSLELLEKRLLTGPEARQQMRSQIKRLKRSINQLKSEPIETLFLPAKKLALELTKQQGKQVEFITTGTWAYLDKSLLNFLYEPVQHLIRNAIDHGLEEPIERERIGKAASGTIKCSATFNDQTFKVIVSDDGKGINFETVREKIVTKGYTSFESAQLLTNEELLPYLFKSGFSTRDNTDIVSGRGIGLDIVKESIESIGGTLRVLSTSTNGTAFEITIPVDKDFLLKNIPNAKELSTEHINEEKIMMLDELGNFFERLHLALRAYQLENSHPSIYESFRLVHSIKGIAGFLGWNKVASFTHQFEELLKKLADKKLEITPDIKNLLVESSLELEKFVEASKDSSEYSLTRIRQLESRILQSLWTTSGNEERAHQFIGQYHLQAVEKFLLPLLKGKKLITKPENNFHKASIQPFGGMVQFNGDKKGFAGIFLSEDILSKIIYPMMTGTKGPTSLKSKMGSLSEFVKSMGAQISESTMKSGMTLLSGAPLIYHGWGQPLKILGNPTYCYRCEINGFEFFLAGDFRLPQELTAISEVETVSYSPNLVLQELKEISNETFKDISVDFNQIATQSDLIGFDNGITSILSCYGKEEDTPDTIVFMSFDPNLSRYFQTREKKLDPLDYLHNQNIEITQAICQNLSHRKINLEAGETSFFLGKAFVSNFNRLFITNKIVGTTSKGKFEIQVLVTKLSD